jgi:class 3 adenylate cyclase
MVITPIEEMMTKVKRISENPLKAQQDEENEQLIIEQYALESKKKKSKEAPLETVMLEQTLVKIGGLLALGFGEAGSNIIAKNMSGGEDINPMLPGQKVICIFGFCDIRNFTDATEELQEGVMLFVNEIGEIVHGLVDKYSGAANKNIGDAFLIVWKFDDDSQEIDPETDEISLVPHLKVNQLCDMAMISFLKIMAALKRSRKMKVYSRHEGLNRRMPGYTVRLGYGLHLGWAIEGAIGSYYKIDASYLSPHVNMSNKLEEMTKSFGAPLLISGAIYDWFTDGTKAMIRQIDHV